MFLKEIEMQGFKSFADKTKVTFEQGVTAVVGPNGSGKSNITESLRWALGESSAKSLRGGKMPDVIFAGTQDRKPLNYASVKVVLDNRDGFLKEAQETVSVERHIYRNGDSDYLIDGKKVRLRDIHDLFMDTGLGRDSFSIISQGRVEAIFNSKPEERRAIFEEAAGVLKYKTRKKETQTKLNQTQDNLDRLEDIIYELDGQIKPLEKQAQTAKRFLELDAQRSKLQLALLVTDIVQGKRDLEGLEVDLAEAKNNLSSYHAQRQELEDRNQTLKGKRQSLTEQLNSAQSNLVDLTRLTTDLEGRLERHQLEQEQGQRSRLDNENQLTQLKENLNQVDLDYSDSLGRQQALQERLTVTRDTLSSIKVDLSRFNQSPDQLLETLREQYVALLQTEAELSNRLTQLEADMAQQQQQEDERHSRTAELTQRLAEAKEKAEETLQTYQAAQTKVADLLGHYQELDQKLTTKRSTYQEKQQTYFAQMDTIKSLKARQSSLEAIQKNHSNFYAGVKAVLQAGDRLPGILGAVSQLLTFDTRYQTALEIALGAASQHIIVSDEQAAKAAINFLRNNRQGRATFLPLTTIKPRQLSAYQFEKLQSSPGFLGVASDLVRYDSQFSTIMQSLLGVTAIFETTDQANRAARQLNYQVRLVTLDGTELRPGGAFSGGANRQNSTTFIQPELDNIQKALTDNQERLKALEQDLSLSKTELERLEEDLLDIKSAGEEARLWEQKNQLNYEQASQTLGDLTRTYNALNLSHSSDNQLDLQAEEIKLKDRLDNIAHKKIQLNQDIENIKADKASINQNLDKLRQNLSDNQLKERELLSELRFEEANQRRFQEEKTKLQQDIDRLTLVLTSTDQQLDDQQVLLISQQLEEAKQRREDEQTKIVRFKFELEDCDGALEDVSDQLARLSQRNDQLIRQQASLESQVEQLTSRLQAYARQLSEDYQMAFSDAKHQVEALENLVLARQQLKDLRGQIKALGPINIDAIEQFDEVNERRNFLSGQRDDLLEAKNMLQATIDDMDGEVKARFKTTFEAIRESFKTTFKQMFGGGSADLVLTENDILTAGVEISVQPPGKKIQSLNLMSGGEKALSALALLFAIIRVKTIPFVILDEVEAALDEANVKRFGDYLNRFDKSSQFIVVTHRKGTMAAADSIYGVTMQESGVSKVLSVKLKDAQKLVK